MMGRDLEEGAAFLGLSTLVWTFAVLLVFCTVGFFAFVEPYFVAKQTQTTRQSNAYITSKQQALRTWYSSWSDLEVRRLSADEQTKEAIASQQRGIVKQMKQDADLIPAEYVPSDIGGFLSTH